MQHRTVLVLVRELGQVEQAPVQEQEVQELALGQVELGQEPELAQELVVQELAQEPVEQGLSQGVSTRTTFINKVRNGRMVASTNVPVLMAMPTPTPVQLYA